MAEDKSDLAMALERADWPMPLRLIEDYEFMGDPSVRVVLGPAPNGKNFYMSCKLVAEKSLSETVAAAVTTAKAELAYHGKD